MKRLLLCIGKKTSCVLVKRPHYIYWWTDFCCILVKRLLLSIGEKTCCVLVKRFHCGEKTSVLYICQCQIWLWSIQSLWERLPQNYYFYVSHFVEKHSSHSIYCTNTLLIFFGVILTTVRCYFTLLKQNRCWFSWKHDVSLSQPNVSWKVFGCYWWNSARLCLCLPCEDLHEGILKKIEIVSVCVHQVNC